MGTMRFQLLREGDAVIDTQIPDGACVDYLDFFRNPVVNMNNQDRFRKHVVFRRNMKYPQFMQGDVNSKDNAKRRYSVCFLL
jgi:hypothetical protein